MSLYLPILMYHQIGEPPPGEKTILFVSVKTFREQLTFLTERGFEAVTPDQLDAALQLRPGAQLPPKPFMITLDDADMRKLSPALEVLSDLGMAAVGYFIAGDPGSLPAPGNIDDLRKLRFVAGSHGLTHRPLTELSAEALRNELTESKLRLETRMGYPVVHLCYPHGSHGPREVQAAGEAGYQTALSTRRGNRHRRSQALRLKRLAIRPHTDRRRLGRYLSLAWHLEHGIKETLGLEKRGAKR
jgi:peptidoglycan/xylan/chitin deacetylase (PgdA/CDA1 family)